MEISYDKSLVDIKQMIDDCHVLYFFNPTATIFSQIDASNHGIGAFDSINIPIEFSSKQAERTDSQVAISAATRLTRITRSAVTAMRTAISYMTSHHSNQQYNG